MMETLTEESLQFEERSTRSSCPAEAEHVFDMHTRKSNPQLSLYNSEEQAVLNEQNPLPSQQYLPSQEQAQSEVDRPVREDISGARIAQENDEEPQLDEMEFNAQGGYGDN